MSAIVPYKHKVKALIRPDLNPEFGSINLYVRNNPRIAAALYYSVLFQGNPALILESTSLKPIFLPDHVILTGSVLEWRAAFVDCKDRDFLEDCYEFFRFEMEIFRIKREGPTWKVST